MHVHKTPIDRTGAEACVPLQEAGSYTQEAERAAHHAQRDMEARQAERAARHDEDLARTGPIESARLSAQLLAWETSSAPNIIALRCVHSDK